MYEPMGQHCCTARQNATMRSRLPSSTAASRRGGGGWWVQGTRQVCVANGSPFAPCPSTARHASLLARCLTAAAPTCDEGPGGAGAGGGRDAKPLARQHRRREPPALERLAHQLRRHPQPLEHQPQRLPGDAAGIHADAGRGEARHRPFYQLGAPSHVAAASHNRAARVLDQAAHAEVGAHLHVRGSGRGGCVSGACRLLSRTAAPLPPTHRRRLSVVSELAVAVIHQHDHLCVV